MKKKTKTTSDAAKRLARYRADISKCVKCGSCRAVCPAFLETRDESFSARGRMALIRAVLEGRLGASAFYGDRLKSCTTCLACEAACASSVPVTDIIQAAKEHVASGCGAPLQDRIAAAFLGNKLLMGAGARFAHLALGYRPASVRGGASGTMPRRGLPRTVPNRGRGKLLFFPGCAITHFQPDIGISAVNVLRMLGYDVIVPENQGCCGRPLLSSGDRKAAGKAAKNNHDLFMRERPEGIVTACASCGLTFQKEYPTLLPPGESLPLVADIHVFIARDLADLELAPLAGTVTWHDPCHLSRGQGLGGKAREILRSIPGITFIEMKDPDRCCGFGGVMRMSHRTLSNRIGDQKAKNISATKADTVITGCPSCRMQIAEALARAGSNVRVLHTVQLIEEALLNAKCEIRNAE